MWLYLGPPWINSCQIWCVRVFHHVLLKYGHENDEMQKKKFDDVTLRYSMRAAPVNAAIKHCMPTRKLVMVLEPCKARFWHNDPVMTGYLLHRPRSDQKTIYFMARPNYTLLGPDQTEAIYHQPQTYKLVSNYNTHVRTPWNEVIKSYNIPVRGNNPWTCLVWQC